MQKRPRSRWLCVKDPTWRCPLQSSGTCWREDCFAHRRDSVTHIWFFCLNLRMEWFWVERDWSRNASPTAGSMPNLHCKRMCDILFHTPRLWLKCNPLVHRRGVKETPAPRVQPHSAQAEGRPPHPPPPPRSATLHTACVNPLANPGFPFFFSFWWSWRT